jgi:hypothetical protein
MAHASPDGPRARLWAMVEEHAAARGRQASVVDACTVAVTATGVNGAGVTMQTTTDSSRVICVTDRVSADLEELQLTFGEGPCRDAFTSRGPVLSADLSGPEASQRWPTFAPAACRAGAAAVFAFPLQLGMVRFGVMDMYRSEPRSLGAAELRDALVLADAATLLLVGRDADVFDGTDGTRADESAHHSLLSEQEGYRAEIDQATGMISVQADVSIDDAFARLRAYAYAQDRRLTDVARDVVARRIRFTPDPSGGPGDGAGPETGKEG